MVRADVSACKMMDEMNESGRRALRVESGMPLHLLKNDRAPDRIIVDVSSADRQEPFSAIRCPLCSWRPSASSLWSCNCLGTPEPFFESCGMVWNTFSTKGRCPGCRHQWQWTTCLRCGQASLHEDWYEAKEEDR